MVAYVPSGVLWMGIPVGGTAHPEPPPAWTRHGRPLPFMRGGIVGSAIDWTHPPVALAPGYVAALENRRLVEEATIPVEKTQGPILLISGQADRMSSPRLAEVAVRRAQQHHFAFPVEHVSYPQAGHLLTLPYLPTTLRYDSIRSGTSMSLMGGHLRVMRLPVQTLGQRSWRFCGSIWSSRAIRLSPTGAPYTWACKRRRTAYACCARLRLPPRPEA